MCHIRRCELCKKDVLTTLNKIAIYHHRSANSSLPEWHIENMMKTKRNQCTFDDSENQGSEVSSSRNQSAESENSVLNGRPDKAHQNSDTHIHNSRDDRNKARTTEERKCIRKHNLMITVMKCRHSESHNNSTKYTHLQTLDSTYTRNRSLENITCYRSICKNLS